ncbi:MAG TPA: anti-sigma factor antagonist [Firmicutes bacterium]|nr:anti-sigma factor antagonist [Bacillota bacterium]
MNVFCEQLDGITVVSVEGELAVPDSDKFKDFLMQRLENGIIDMVIDFKDVPAIDSSGISALLALLQAARRKGGDIRIASTNERIDEVFKQVGLQHVFKKFTSRDDGVASFSSMEII